MKISVYVSLEALVSLFTSSHPADKYYHHLIFGQENPASIHALCDNIFDNRAAQNI